MHDGLLGVLALHGDGHGGTVPLGGKLVVAARRVDRPAQGLAGGQGGPAGEVVAQDHIGHRRGQHPRRHSGDLCPLSRLELCLDGPEGQASHGTGQHGPEARRPGPAQEGHGGEGQQQGQDGGLRQGHQQGQPPVRVGEEEIGPHRKSKGGDATHAEGQQEAEGVGHGEHGGRQPGLGGPGGLEQEKGEENAESQQPGQGVWVAENAGDADAGFIASGHKGVLPAQVVHQSHDRRGKQPCGGGVHAEKGTEGAENRHRHTQLLHPVLFFQPKEQNAKDTKGGEVFCRLLRRQPAPFGGKAGDQGEEEPDPHRQRSGGQPPAQVVRRRLAKGQKEKDRRRGQRDRLVQAAALEQHQPCPQKEGEEGPKCLLGFAVHGKDLAYHKGNQGTSSSRVRGKRAFEDNVPGAAGPGDECHCWNLALHQWGS